MVMDGRHHPGREVSLVSGGTKDTYRILTKGRIDNLAGVKARAHEAITQVKILLIHQAIDADVPVQLGGIARTDTLVEPAILDRPVIHQNGYDIIAIDAFGECSVEVAC